MEDDGELPKTLVKLRRTPSDSPRPASTPPVIAASAVQDEDEEERIMAELEVRRSVSGRHIHPVPLGSSVLPPVLKHGDVPEIACKSS